MVCFTNLFETLDAFPTLYTCEKRKISQLKILKLRIYYERENLWGSKARMNNYNRKFVRWKPVGGRDADPAERQTRFSISKTWTHPCESFICQKMTETEPRGNLYHRLAFV